MPNRQSASNKRRKTSSARKGNSKVLEPLPVTLVSGFLGSGKTSLLRHLIREKDTDCRYCIIVNEISEFNVDAQAIQQGRLLQTEEKLVEMSNGCICCTLREDLLLKLKELQASGEYDRVIIESSGIAEPIQVAETFFFEVEGKSLQGGIAPLTHCVSVVDASTVMETISDNKAPDEGLSTSGKDLSELLFDQIEFANVIIVNKTDLVPQIHDILALIKKLNPQATVIPAVHGKVDLESIVGAPVFTVEMAESARGWMDDVLNPKAPETLEYGISSFAFRADVPFHPERLHKWMTDNFILAEMSMEEEDEPEEPLQVSSEGGDEVMMKLTERKSYREEKYGRILRSKGFIWIAGEHRAHVCIGWSHAGNILNIDVGDTWESIDKVPTQGLIFIGQHMKRDMIIEDLQACLLSHGELERLHQSLENQTEFPNFKDPFDPITFVQEVHE